MRGTQNVTGWEEANCRPLPQSLLGSESHRSHVLERRFGFRLCIQRQCWTVF